MSTDFWCAKAWLPNGITERVLLRVDAGTITEVSIVDSPPAGATVLRGLVLPGFANVHSHAFHRALRGRTHHGIGNFWTWRTAMYRIAERLDPDNYYRLARAVYAEMVVAGYTAVGEFHYVHHGKGGVRYNDPNAMGEALRAAAAEAGIRLTLLDTCYLAGGIGRELDETQLRFSDGDARSWAQRVGELRADENTVIGAAIHSVRAVPRVQIADMLEVRGPLHVHLSEQPAENEQCQQAYGCTPTELLAAEGALGERTTAVHATHLGPRDIEILGAARVSACFCPTTEADLADGIGPARELADAGALITLGTDQHAVIDPLVEARALEHGERLRSGTRGRFQQAELLAASTVDGHAALGRPEAGTIAVGAPSDFVAIDTESQRTAGAEPEQILLCANAADVHTVIINGKLIAQQGKHAQIGDVGALLAEEIGELWL